MNPAMEHAMSLRFFSPLLLLLALAACGSHASVASNRLLYVTGPTPSMADFVAKEHSCRPGLQMSRPRAEWATQSQVVVSVPGDYSPAAVEQLSREAKAAGLRYSLKEKRTS
jgi:hypothetical protein